MKNITNYIKQRFIFPGFKPEMDYRETQKFVLKWILNIAAIIGFLTLVMGVFEALSLGQPGRCSPIYPVFLPHHCCSHIKRKTEL